MSANASHRHAIVRGALSVCLAAALSAEVIAIPAFNSIDYRLPNPDRPYEMTNGPVRYDSPLDFTIYDLEFQPSKPEQLDYPTRREDGRYEFDSTFDITYKATISTGDGPTRPWGGTGKARAVGISRPDSGTPGDFIYSIPQVFDTELVSFSLFGLSPIPEAMIRESPTLKSTGVIIREDQCPVCLAPVTYWRISSFFDIFTEVTFSGGNWAPADKAIHVEQAPDGLPPGDYNGDKVVDAGDYTVWRQTLGHRGAGLPADGDWSGEVDAGDYGVWRGNFGQQSSAGFVAGAAIVPEPAAAILFTLSMLLPPLFNRCQRVRR